MVNWVCVWDTIWVAWDQAPQWGKKAKKKKMGERNEPIGTGEEWHYKISVLEVVVVVYVNWSTLRFSKFCNFFCNIRKLASLNKRKNNDCDIFWSKHGSKWSNQAQVHFFCKPLGRDSNKKKVIVCRLNYSHNEIHWPDGRLRHKRV